MPVDFLTNKQKETYGKFPEELGTEILHKLKGTLNTQLRHKFVFFSVLKWTHCQ